MVGTAVWPEIVDRDTWATARAILTDPVRQTAGNAPRHLLSRITFWAENGCGRPCRVSTRGGTGRSRRLVYRCPHGHVIRSKEFLEACVTEVTPAYLEREGVLPAAPDAEGMPGESAVSDVQVFRARLETLAVDYVECLSTQEQVHAHIATLPAQIADADRVLQ